MTGGPIAQELRRTKRQSRSLADRGTICLASTSGGHLAQLEAIAASLQYYDLYLVTVRSPQALSVFPKTRKHYVHQILRNPIGFVLNAAQSVAILIRERPCAVLTTGAGDALPTALWAACLGIPVVFVESMARTENPSLFGRIINRFAQLTVVQWPGLSIAYASSVLAAPIFRPRGTRDTVPSVPNIVVLTGTHSRGFDRLLASIDELLERGELEANVFAQVGHARYRPRNYGYLDFLPRDSLLEHMRLADVVVTHDGAGSIGDAFFTGKPVVVVPRMWSQGEVSYHTTSDLAQELARLGWVTLVTNPLELASAIARLNEAPALETVRLGPEVGEVVRQFLDSLSASSSKPSIISNLSTMPRSPDGRHHR